MSPRAVGRRGLLVALEGIDGSGKSTLRAGIARRLRAAGWVVGLWKEPTRPALGRRALALSVDDPVGSAIHFTLDRLLARPRLERLLDRSDVVLSDRSFYSTVAYQGSALPRSGRAALERFQRGVALVPDLVLWVDVPVPTALARVGRRGRLRAPTERARTLRRVAATFRELARRPGWRRVDGRQPPAAMAEAAVAAIRPLRRPTAGRRRRG